ncbi:sulfotransferase family protein [Pseudoalteromonas sp. C2R02]|uniref:sulfotransferase n=1 Tax=Pseudoalteromonas sp. C2R02 TaxID=2841565 RepID=UPI001C09C30F|nr:sulfotransferase [Pseudoalteromonas sp. C2R02]MBU2968921.1 sulfotransferase family protein [Pseudoalteromonas sp. C2R02]
MNEVTEQKIFIIGLPRTATTSVCAAMLELGFKTAHTAYTNQSMNDAQVIADTPVFCDYQLLDKTYPNAKFIYLQRDSTVWLPSIRQLLIRMYKNLQRTDGGFNPTLKRCYNDIFSPLTLENVEKDDFLQSCYDRHQQGINEYFKGREQDLLQIDVSDKNSFDSLLAFLEIDTIQTQLTGFERINIGGKVTAWKQIKSPLKIEATQKGKVDRVRP